MELEIYQDQNGDEPFLEWLSSKRDKSTAARIRNRLRRVEETGNLGDYRSVGSGVYEIGCSLILGTGYTSVESEEILFC